MSYFLRLLGEDDQGVALHAICTTLRSGGSDPRCFEVNPTSFNAVPGRPFAYWVSDAVREMFSRIPPFSDEGREAQRALSTNDDFRYLRLWWERDKDFSLERPASGWLPFAKGGEFSPFYADVYLLVNWIDEGRQIEADVLRKYPYLNGNAEWVLHRECNYLRPGLTWPRRTNGLSFRVLPRGCIFADKGPSAFVVDDDSDELLELLCLLNSRAFGILLSVQLARTELAQSFEVGLVQQTPLPSTTNRNRLRFREMGMRGWSLRRALDTVKESSHAFLLPELLRGRVGHYEPTVIKANLEAIRSEIDAIAFDIYGFPEVDRNFPAAQLSASEGSDLIEDADDTDDAQDDAEPDRLPFDSLYSWAVGVAFGRFDWRLATGERDAPPEPDPFDPLPAKSPGMLPDGAAPFHAHSGALVDDQGHPHDLARLVEEVLARVDCPVPDNVRRWLQRDFFPFHLQRYSKSRRKAPIYWPLSTGSGSYTLWVYYPSLTSQTLYTAINDFLEPKLKQVAQEVTALRTKGAARTRDDDKRFEGLHDFELELIELRDTLLGIAPTFRPNHDDGVQITAAPLWQLFRHKPWQKVLKDTWAKLQKGDYDWAHLAYTYWPDRVREKCKTDKSLAIAHDLEHLYVEPEAKPKKRGRKNA